MVVQIVINTIEQLINLRSVRINSYKEKILRSVQIVTLNFFHLYGFMLLSGSIKSDNRNGSTEKF